MGMYRHWAHKVLEIVGRYPGEYGRNDLEYAVTLSILDQGPLRMGIPTARAIIRRGIGRMIENGEIAESCQPGSWFGAWFKTKCLYPVQAAGDNHSSPTSFSMPLPEPSARSDSCSLLPEGFLAKFLRGM